MQNIHHGRRSFLRRAAIGTTLLGLPTLVPALARSNNAPFTIVALPDTQFYTRYDGPANRPGIFLSQTDWIIENLASENIVFVSHLGDVVNNGAAKPIEWQRANAAMDRLHGRVPYSVVPGNHDLDRIGSRSSGYSAFVEHYGRARYNGMPWYGGSSNDQYNHFQVFAAGTWTFLHLGLELEPSDSTLAWAKQVLDAHPGLPTIVSTHSYQNDSSGRTTQSQFQGNSGEQVWQKLIKPNPQIFMVLNGHFYAKDGERHQVSTNAQGQAVFEMQSDYQDYPDGGGGYLRLIHFDPAANTIAVHSYSPWLDKYMTDGDSKFSFAVDLAKRLGTGAATPSVIPTATPSPTPSPIATPSPTTIPIAPPTASAQPTAVPASTPAPPGDVRVFLPIADAGVYSNAPKTNYGTSADFTIDKGSPTRSAYLRFEVTGIDSSVRRALVRLFVPSDGTNNGPTIALASNDWNEHTITWLARPLPGQAVANATKLARNTWAEYDVSAVVPGDGAYTFVLVADSTDGVKFSSRESAKKPQLVVML